MRMRRVRPVAYAPEWGTEIVYNIWLQVQGGGSAALVNVLTVSESQ